VFMSNIDWAQVYERYQLAVHGASEPFAAAQEELASAEVLDVRRAGMFEKADALIPGARWQDPARSGVGPRRAQGQGDRGLLHLRPRSRAATALRLRRRA
jgi:hypothetical protein